MRDSGVSTGWLSQTEVEVEVPIEMIRRGRHYHTNFVGRRTGLGDPSSSTDPILVVSCRRGNSRTSRYRTSWTQIEIPSIFGPREVAWVDQKGYLSLAYGSKWGRVVMEELGSLRRAEKGL